MKDAFAEINTAFKAAGNPGIRIVYGSSGNFTAQIMNGAPFNLFISADEYFPIELYKKGKAIDQGVVYAIGKLAIISKNSAAISLGDSKSELIKIISKANKIAIAKPELSPYGKAAIEYLKAEGLWDIAKDKLIYGDNIGIATMYVVTGASDVGFTALSLAKSAEVAKETNFILVNSKLYKPIQHITHFYACCFYCLTIGFCRRFRNIFYVKRHQHSIVKCLNNCFYCCKASIGTNTS